MQKIEFEISKKELDQELKNIRQEEEQLGRAPPAEPAREGRRSRSGKREASREGQNAFRRTEPSRGFSQEPSNAYYKYRSLTPTNQSATVTANLRSSLMHTSNEPVLGASPQALDKSRARVDEEGNR